MLLLKTFTVISQSKIDEKLLLTNFVKSVFIEKKSAEFVADNYIYIESINNSKYSIDDRVKILNKHLKKIKKEKSHLIDVKDFSILSYNDYKGDKAIFSKGTENIFILLSKNNIVMYFYLLNDKILSFDYINKGDEGLFIIY